MKPELILKMKEQFKAEMQAYNAYDMIKSCIDDEHLIEALEEIMYDEYLHAKFLRNYMIHEEVYNPADHIECEKMYKKIIDD